MKKIYFIILALLSFSLSYANTFSESQIKSFKEKVVYLQSLSEFSKSPIKSYPILTSTQAANHIDSITFDDGSRKIFQYNDNDQIIDFKYYKFIEFDVTLKEHHTFDYDNDGNLTLFVFNMLSDNDGWIIYQKEEYSYYSDGTLKSQISWDYETDNENPSLKVEYTYNGNTTTLNAFSWNEVSLEWKIEIRQVIEYNGDVILNADVYSPNEETGDLELSMRMEFGYNNAGQITYNNYLSFDEETNDWIIMWKSTTDYNADNNPILEKQSSIFGDMEFGDETRYTYNDNGQLTKEEEYTSSFFNTTLTLASQIEYAYSNGKLTSETESSAEYTGEMFIQLKTEFTYKNNSSANSLIIPDVYTDDLYYEPYEYGLIAKVTQSIFNWDTEELQVSKVASYFYSDETSTPDESNDATLSNLMIDGINIDGFNSSTLVYTIELTEGTQSVPVVSVTTNNENATFTFDETEVLPGSTVVIVTAEDGSQLTYTINFEVEASSDASLSEIQVDGTTITNFSPSIFNYDYGLPNGTTLVPEVTASATNVSATVEVSQATNVLGIATILVTAENETTFNTYNVTFFTIANNDASLSGIQINGEYLNDFNASTHSYTVVLPFGTTTIPEITATGTDENATINYTQASELPGSASIAVTAVDGATQLTYTINFEIAQSNIATLSSLSIDGTSLENFDASVYTYDIVLANGTTEIPQIAATATDENANVEINQATELPGEAIIIITAEDGTTISYTITFTVAVGISDELLNMISVYPNPFKDYLNIELPEQLELKSITIYNQIGENVFYTNREITSNNFTIETSELVNGLYFLTYRFIDGNSIQYKIAKY